eukprot:350422-Chlamydomonas_euryale.AAC.2
MLGGGQRGMCTRWTRHITDRTRRRGPGVGREGKEKETGREGEGCCSMGPPCTVRHPSRNLAQSG